MHQDRRCKACARALGTFRTSSKAGESTAQLQQHWSEKKRGVHERCNEENGNGDRCLWISPREPFSACDHQLGVSPFTVRRTYTVDVREPQARCHAGESREPCRHDDAWASAKLYTQRTSGIPSRCRGSRCLAERSLLRISCPPAPKPAGTQNEWCLTDVRRYAKLMRRCVAKVPGCWSTHRSARPPVVHGGRG